MKEKSEVMKELERMKERNKNRKIPLYDKIKFYLMISISILFILSLFFIGDDKYGHIATIIMMSGFGCLFLFSMWALFSNAGGSNKDESLPINPKKSYELNPSDIEKIKRGEKLGTGISGTSLHPSRKTLEQREQQNLKKAEEFLSQFNDRKWRKDQLESEKLKKKKTLKRSSKKKKVSKSKQSIITQNKMKASNQEETDHLVKFLKSKFLEDITDSLFLTTDLTPEVKLPGGIFGIDNIYDGELFLKANNGFKYHLPLLFKDTNSDLPFIAIAVQNLKEAQLVIDYIISKNHYTPKKEAETEGWQYLFKNKFFVIGYLSEHSCVRINMLHNLIDVSEETK
jgi:hypothetical protein